MSATEAELNFLANPETVPLKKNYRLWRPLVAYWILGLCNNYGYVVMLSAAHDIISSLNGSSNSTEPLSDRKCNHMSTGAILLADIVPSLMVKFLAPFVPFFIQVRIALCIGLAAAGFISVAFADSEGLAIAGVVFTSMSSGLGEVSLLQFSSFYNKNVISTWSSGTGGAGILGAVSYAGLKVLKLETKTIMLIMLVVPVAMAAAFWMILPQPDPNNAQYAIEKSDNANTKEQQVVSGFVNKIKLLPGLQIFMIPLILVYLFEYFINQGLFELVNYENIFLSHDDQYRWLQVIYQVGVFLSRSSVNLFHVRKTWILGVLQFVNVILFTAEAIWYFIPNIWIVFLLTLWEGMLGGAAYVNTFYKISVEVPEERKQFSMSVTSLSDTIGITLAGVLAIPSHNAICKLPKPTRLTF